MDNINLNGLTNEQLALICATTVVSRVVDSTWTDDGIAESIQSIAKASLDFLNNPEDY